MRIPRRDLEIGSASLCLFPIAPANQWRRVLLMNVLQDLSCVPCAWAAERSRAAASELESGSVSDCSLFNWTLETLQNEAEQVLCVSSRTHARGELENEDGWERTSSAATSA